MVHVIVAVLGVFGALWSLAIFVIGGFTFALFGITIHAHDPFRPLAVAALCGLIYVGTSGPLNLRRFITPLAILLALSAALAGVARNSWTAGGADSYAYVSQAELWLSGNLTVPVPLAETAPMAERRVDVCAAWFPSGRFRLCHRAGNCAWPSIVDGSSQRPLQATARCFSSRPSAGRCWSGLTFAIGRRLVSDLVGLVAAWLVATSPAVLAMLVSPMSDVPAAALWAAAIYFALGNSNASALAAGLASSGAILIRPNLAPLAAVLVVWRLWSGLKPCATAHGDVGAKPKLARIAVARIAVARCRRQGFSPAVLMIAGAIPGCLFIAWINSTLYGSPLASGYGSLSELFSIGNVLTNLRRYGGWLIESQTPLALAGIVAL